MGQLTISMAILNSYVSIAMLVYQRANLLTHNDDINNKKSRSSVALIRVRCVGEQKPVLR